VHLLVVAQVGLAGEALVALLAGEGLLLGVDAPVADELRGDAEGLAAVRALVALGLRVDAPVVLERHEVGELLLAGVAEVSARLVAVLVVEQRAGVPVGAPTLVADVCLAAHGRLPVTAAASGAVQGRRELGQPVWVQALGLHERQVKPRAPTQVPAAPSAPTTPVRGGVVGVVLGLGAGPRDAMLHLLVESEAGLAGETALAQRADQLALLQMHLAVVLQLRGHAEGLATLRAAVAPRLRVDAAVVLEGEQVGVGLEAHGAVVDADGVGVFVVEEGAGMTVGAAALITCEPALFSLV